MELGPGDFLWAKCQFPGLNASAYSTMKIEKNFSKIRINYIIRMMILRLSRIALQAMV